MTAILSGRVLIYSIEEYSIQMSEPVKRAYVSTRRAEQARATRESILEAAGRLFSTSGYTATTIQAVAREAGVAVQTVYATFGNKRELLLHTLEAAVTGDTGSRPIAEHAESRAIADEPDPRRRAEMDAAMVAQISPRIAPIVRAVREAAAVDPEMAQVSEQITARRRQDMAAAVEALTGPDGPTMELEAAIGTLYVVYSPEVYTELVGDLGWSLDRYQSWVADMLLRTVMGPPSPS
jgi:TetR/AcrR family transcriptional regulator of autoinduction and epiphytic fitness